MKSVGKRSILGLACTCEGTEIFSSLKVALCILIRTNKMQQYAGIYLLHINSKRFGCLSHPSSGVHKTVTAASGTGHSI